MAGKSTGDLYNGLSSAPGESEYPSGFPQNICDDVPQEKYLCSNCNNLLNKARQTLCGHRYCLACVNWLMRNNMNLVCKKCKEEDPNLDNENSILIPERFFNDAAINKEISELKVHCANQGCNWRSTLKNYEDHQSQCDYALIPCNIGCGHMVIRKNLASHLEKGCAKNMLVCQTCSHKMSQAEFQKHTCQSSPAKERKPSKTETREKNRQLSSAKNKDPCRFSEVGCTFKGTKEKVKEHESTGLVAHLQLLLQVISNLKVSCLTTISKGDGGKAHVSGTEFKLTELEESLASMQMQGAVEVNGDLETDGYTEPSISQGAQKEQLGEFKQKLSELQQKIYIYENIVTVLNREVEKNQAAVLALEHQNKNSQDNIANLELQVAEQQGKLAVKDLLISSLHLRISALEEASHDGTFIWKISNLSKKMQEAAAGRENNLYSPAFYTGKYGYKVCMRCYLNGDGMGKGTHISLFFVVMKGEYDALLSWPFKHKVTFFLLDQNQREHVIDAFRPDLSSTSFQRPVRDMNVASGCPLFFPHAKLKSPKHAYSKDDTLFIKCIVDTTA
ncbi:TNF receptor-associated factor 1 [Lepisosteus oculatus]|uniref:TNF receptor-associated factor n=1 Tax=Lepisosteus oculatus TaxID=7918 RepID=W5MH88_LEPOC|nr:PREDICTED: TNF receptor-associated factor 1 [Lepisosteus oculatus]XP_015222732.1 PREDICTED: TNF receptor-associated factor 1 [Lepisosteus oculatus]XP_015222733.1 PREDICTED: TNF receptor-associated factor 1 [Lepisosteus oculatus]XP_015222734.1 PREDICTED: TNF receptor-associated factor 1 [Lepisosteus oculatus]